jgi:hypothetical protein
MPPKLIFWVLLSYKTLKTREKYHPTLKISGEKKWESNGFTKMDIRDLTKELYLKKEERKNKCLNLPIGIFGRSF